MGSRKFDLAPND